MIELTREFLIGNWKHQDWSLSLSGFNYAVLQWPNNSKAIGSWILMENEVILTYNFIGEENKNIYLFKILEILDDQRIKTLDIERNKEEILERI